MTTKSMRVALLAWAEIYDESSSVTACLEKPLTGTIPVIGH